MVPAGESDYADPGFQVPEPTHEWNWSLGQIVTALLDAGLHLEFLHEFDRLFFPAMEGMVRGEDGWFRLPEPLHGKVPLMFSLRAVKG